MRATVLLAAFWGAAWGLAQQAKVITFTDEGVTVGTEAVIADYNGFLPPPGPPLPEPPQMSGWPVTIGVQPNFKPTRGLVFEDLDGDGNLEIITSSTDSNIYAWDLSGALMPGFPVGTIGWPQYAPSTADMDGDGDIEIVQFTRGQTSGGRVYALDHMGNVLPGFPINVNNNNIASCPTLVDLDGDGVMEIIGGERAYPVGYIHIWRLDGTEWGGNWPVALDHVPTGTAAVGDVDNDGALEIFYMSYNSMYLLALDGTTLPGWPKQVANTSFSYQSAAMADLDGDGDLEIVVGAHKSAAGCYVFHHDGTAYPGWPKYFGTWSYGPPTVTDLEGDGQLDIIDGRAGVFGDPNSACFWAWDSDGNTRAGFPYVADHGNGGGSDGPYVTADIDGDGALEIFADHNVMSGDQGYLFGVDAQGNNLPGFPLRPLGFTYMNGATIGDVDGDGDYELGVISYGDYTADVNLYDLPDTYATTGGDWPVYHGRNSRGGLYPTVGAECVGDLDGDGTTGQADLGILLADWGCTGGNCVGDLDGDGSTGQSDLGMLLADWGCGT